MMNWPNNFVNQVICGDALDTIRQMPDGSVNCCITSPPYWGLRDYGTGEWQGGDSRCDHKNRQSFQRGTSQSHSHYQESRKNAVKPYGETCGKCGAVRVDKQLGLEPTPAEYVKKMVEIFREVRRILADDGTCWLNLGDSYSGSWGDSGNRPERTGKAGTQRQRKTEPIKREGHPQDKKPVTVSPPGIPRKNLIMMPARVMLALQSDGWIIRSEIIWSKSNALPESVLDRPSTSHEKLYLMAKMPDYYYDCDSIREPYSPASIERKKFQMNLSTSPGHHQPHIADDRHDEKHSEEPNPLGKNRRTVWEIGTASFAHAHFATFPEKLIEPCILAGCPEGGIILDPFFGSGTVGKRAKELGRRWIGIDLNPEYCELATKRTGQKELFENGHS